MIPLPCPDAGTSKNPVALRYLAACTAQGDALYFTDCGGTGHRVHTHRVVPSCVSTWDPSLAAGLFPTYCVLCRIAGRHAPDMLKALRACGAIEPV